MSDYAGFWDEPCLLGGLPQPPLPAAPSLLDDALFCDEGTLDSLEPLSPAAAVAVVAPTNCPSPLQLAAPFLEADEQDDAPESGGSPWRTFMDDAHPLRARVQVTVTGKRVAPGDPCSGGPPRAGKRARIPDQKLVTMSGEPVSDCEEGGGYVTGRLSRRLLRAAGGQPTFSEVSASSVSASTGALRSKPVALPPPADAVAAVKGAARAFKRACAATPVRRAPKRAVKTKAKTEKKVQGKVKTEARLARGGGLLAKKRKPIRGRGTTLARKAAGPKDPKKAKREEMLATLPMPPALPAGAASALAVYFGKGKRVVPPVKARQA